MIWLLAFSGVVFDNDAGTAPQVTVEQNQSDATGDQGTTGDSRATGDTGTDTGSTTGP